MLYPKINTLWKRDDKGKIMVGEYSSNVFPNIRKWVVTEKIDGTNIRVIYDGQVVQFGGKTDNAQIPTELLKNIMPIFTLDKFREKFPDCTKVVLFGEGYGRRIQNGGNYCDKQSIILFDVFVDPWWLEYDNVVDIAKFFGVKVVPRLNMDTIGLVVANVESDPWPPSMIAEKLKDMEGFVAKADPMVLFRDGTPVMFKLKFRDYR